MGRKRPWAWLVGLYFATETLFLKSSVVYWVICSKYCNIYPVISIYLGFFYRLNARDQSRRASGVDLNLFVMYLVSRESLLRILLLLCQNRVSFQLRMQSEMHRQDQ